MNTYPICEREIGAAQLHSVTEIAPNSLILCVNKSPILYSFRAGARAIRHGVKITLVSSEFSVAVMLNQVCVDKTMILLFIDYHASSSTSYIHGPSQLLGTQL